MDKTNEIEEYVVTDKYGILGNLFQLLKSYKMFKNKDEFLYLLFNEESYFTNNNLWSYMARYDYISKEPLIRIKNRLEYKEILCGDIQRKVNSLNLSSNQIDKINQSLALILEKITQYQDKKGNYFKYDSAESNRLLTYYSLKEKQYSLDYNIYLLIFFAVNKTSPTNFYFGIRYQKDLEEFKHEILEKYGVNSPAGARAILRLAEKGNIFASYEYADILYYGKGPSCIPNYEQAHQFFKDGAGIDYRYRVNEDACNPLSLWCLAYMNYNYHRRLDLKDIPPIPELEKMSPDERLDSAVHLAKTAFTLIQSAASSNLLGVIAYNEGEECRKKYELDEPIKYFTYAAEHQYVFGYNNLAMVHTDNIFLDPDNAETHFIKALKNYNQASDFYCNWSSNKLGLIYLTGKISAKINKVKQTKEFAKYKSLSKAKAYFKKACEYELDDASAWAYANLLVYFKEEYGYYEDTALMEEHIRRIILLNNTEALDFLKKELGDNEVVQGIINKCVSGT